MSRKSSILIASAAITGVCLLIFGYVALLNRADGNANDPALTMMPGIDKGAIARCQAIVESGRWTGENYSEVNSLLGPPNVLSSSCAGSVDRLWLLRRTAADITTDTDDGLVPAEFLYVESSNEVITKAVVRKGRVPPSWITGRNGNM